jgi:hypothetical protein
VDLPAAIFPQRKINFAEARMVIASHLPFDNAFIPQLMPVLSVFDKYSSVHNSTDDLGC